MTMERNNRTRIRKCLLLALCLCFAVRISAGAAAVPKYVSVDLPLKKTVTQKETGYKYNEKTGRTTWTYYRYKVVIPQDGLLKITIAKGASRISGLSLSMYSRLNADDILDDWFFSGKKKQTVSIPVSRGTYYFAGAAKSKMSCTFTAVKPGTNYCADRAAVLKRGAKAKICQTPGHNFPRWYRIRLTRKQKISFWSSRGDLVVLTDVNMDPVGVKRAGANSTRWTSGKVPAGTYYLCVLPGGVKEKLYSNRYYYTTIYWK